MTQRDESNDPKITKFKGHLDSQIIKNLSAIKRINMIHLMEYSMTLTTIIKMSLLNILSIKLYFYHEDEKEAKRELGEET